MRGIPFIKDLFKNVLSVSKAIDGRFYICPKMGSEINSDNLDEVLPDEVRNSRGKKYPLVLMMPPFESGEYEYNKPTWVDYNISLFFLKTSFYDSLNQTQDRNVATGTSTHTVVSDWHDMKRCAANFIRVLKHLIRIKSLMNGQFRLHPGLIIKQVSFVGVDRTAGVRLDFKVSLYQECELEDYNLDEVEAIQIPVGDPHPEHTL